MTARPSQAGIEALGDGRLRNPEGQRIGGKGPRRVAKHVARHLIEHDDGCQRRARIGKQGFARFGGQHLMQGQEALADGCVEVLVLLEPLFRLRFLEPERQHVAGPVCRNHHGLLASLPSRADRDHHMPFGPKGRDASYLAQVLRSAAVIASRCLMQLVELGQGSAGYALSRSAGILVAHPVPADPWSIFIRRLT